MPNTAISLPGASWRARHGWLKKTIASVAEASSTTTFTIERPPFRRLVETRRTVAVTIASSSGSSAAISTWLRRST